MRLKTAVLLHVRDFEHGTLRDVPECISLQPFCTARVPHREKLIRWFARQTAGALVLLYLDIIRFNQQFYNK